MNLPLHSIWAPPKQVELGTLDSTFKQIERDNDDMDKPSSKQNPPSTPAKLGAAATEKSKVHKWQWEDNGSWRKSTALDVKRLCKKE